MALGARGTSRYTSQTRAIGTGQPYSATKRRTGYGPRTGLARQPIRPDSIKTNASTFGRSKTYYRNASGGFSRNRIRTTTTRARAMRLQAGAKFSRAMRSADLTAGHYAAKWLNKAANWANATTTIKRGGNIVWQGKRINKIAGYGLAYGGYALIGAVSYGYARSVTKRIQKTAPKRAKAIKARNAARQAQNRNPATRTRTMKASRAIQRTNTFKSINRASQKNVQNSWARKRKRAVRVRRDSKGRYAGSY